LLVVGKCAFVLQPCLVAGGDMEGDSSDVDFIHVTSYQYYVSGV